MKNTIGIKYTYFKDKSEDIGSSKNFNDNEKKYFSLEKLIDFTEPIRTQTLLFFKLNNKETISGMYNHQLIKVGEKINFEFNITKIDFFDYEKEKAI